MKILKNLAALLLITTLITACKNDTSDSDNLSPKEKSEVLVKTLDAYTKEQWGKIVEKELTLRPEGGLIVAYYDKSNTIRKADINTSAALGQFKETFYLDEKGNLVYAINKNYNVNIPVSASQENMENEKDIKLEVEDTLIAKAYFDKNILVEYIDYDGSKSDEEVLKERNENFKSLWQNYLDALK